MAKKSDVEKSLKKPKYLTRTIHRCWRCGRRRGYIRYFKICRICFRELATKGSLPGIRKSSW